MRFIMSNLNIILSVGLLFTLARAATINVVNQCNYTVWAAALPGGGQRLDPGQTWTLNVAQSTTTARIWGRTNCSFDANGRGECETGDCNGFLRCQAWGTPPNTLAEYALNQVNDSDYFDISLVDGFNIPMDFSPTTNVCQGIRCAGDINGQCPAELKAPGGCNNPCAVFENEKYCCNNGSCDPSYYKVFMSNCPNAYSYPQDDRTGTFTCPGGTNYRVTFCPLADLGVCNDNNYNVIRIM